MFYISQIGKGGNSYLRLKSKWDQLNNLYLLTLLDVQGVYANHNQVRNLQQVLVITRSAKQFLNDRDYYSDRKGDHFN